MAWGSVTESDFVTCDADYEFFVASGQAVAIALNPRETGSLVFNVDSAGTTDNVEVEVLQGHRISNGNGLDGAASATSLDLNTTADSVATDDDLNGTFIVMTSGGEAGEGKLITDSTASTDTVTLENALSGTPSASETYALYRLSGTKVTIRMDVAISDEAPHNAAFAVDAMDGQYVLARVRATGVTDAHRVRMSYQTDGVSA